MNSNTQAVPTDQALQLVADRRRRKVLRHLIDERDEVVSIDELVDTIAGEEPDTEAQQTKSVERIATELHHVHLPKLADTGVVHYDTRRGTLRYRSRDRVEELVQFVSERLE